MTAPFSDDPFEGAVDRHERGFRRELIGLLSVLIGLVTVGAVLLTVDPRWVIGLGGGLLVAGGLWLGRVPDDEGE